MGVPCLWESNGRVRAERLAARSRAITFFVFLHLPLGLFSLFYPLVLDEVIDTTGILFLFCLWFYFFGDLCTARRAQTAGSSFLLGSAAVGAFTIYSFYYFLSKVRDLYLFLDCTCSYIRNVILLLERNEREKKGKWRAEIKDKWSRVHYNTVPTLRVLGEILHPLNTRFGCSVNVFYIHGGKVLYTDVRVSPFGFDSASVLISPFFKHPSA